MSQLPPPDTRPGRVRPERGFSLIEVMVTVVIITVIAAAALPNLRKGLRDRRTRQAAEEVARVYRDARLRAMGRGSAVLVHYDAATRSFVVKEALMGATSAAQASCARLPSASCQLAAWNDSYTNTSRGTQTVETLALDESFVTQVELPSKGTAAQDRLSVCFSPFGRAFYSTAAWPPSTTSLTPLSQVPIVRVYRKAPGTTQREGLERRVVVLPNGQARIQTAGNS